MLNAILTSTLTHRNLFEHFLFLSSRIQIFFFRSVHLMYKFCWNTIESVAIMIMRQRRRLRQKRRQQNIFYYFRKCTQNDFVYMKFSTLIAKSALDQTKIADYTETYFKLAMLSVCMLKLMLTKFLAVCIKVARSFEWVKRTYIRINLFLIRDLFRN